jgi:hypothetical protein
MRASGWLRWFGLAVLGIVLAAGVAVAASRLTSQHIGIASEPVSAGEQLAPAAVRRGTKPTVNRRTRRQRRRGHRSRGHAPRAAQPPVSTSPAPPVSTAPTSTAPAPLPGGEVAHDDGGGGGGHSGGADD